MPPDDRPTKRPPDYPLDLRCHPLTPAPAVRSLEARVTPLADGRLEIAFCLRGDIARLRVPEPCSPGPADALWEHTCFEAFIARSDAPAYREFNFSPSGRWARYAFAAYRERDETGRPDAPPPRIAAQRLAGRLELLAVLAADDLPAGEGPLQIGLSAVVEADDTVAGRHSYWALHHPTSRPDFHHRAGFVYALPDPRADSRKRL